jgi:hypothetical protein
MAAAAVEAEVSAKKPVHEPAVLHPVAAKS